MLTYKDYSIIPKDGMLEIFNLKTNRVALSITGGVEYAGKLIKEFG